MKAKRWITLALVLVMVASLLSLAACKNGGGNTASKSGNGDNTTSQDYTAEDLFGEGASQEQIEALQNSGTILMYTLSADVANGKFENDPYTKNYLDWAKKYYGLTIKYRYRAWTGNMVDKFFVDYAGNDAPDYLSVNYYFWPKVGLRNVLFSVDELKDKGVVGLDHPSITATSESSARFSVGDKCYAIATVPHMVVTGVNTDLFAKYNVKSPVEYYKEGTWDFDAYLKCCKELTRTLSDGTKIWGAAGWNYNWFLTANDAALIVWNDDQTQIKPALADPKVGRACNLIAEVFTKEYTPISDGNLYFKKGLMGMFSYTVNNLAQILQNVTFKWDIVPFPYGPDNTTGAYPAEVYFSAAVSSTKNPQGVISYVISSNLYKKIGVGADWIPKEDYYNQTGYGVYNKDQMALYESLIDKADYDMSLGVGNLAVDFGFWNNLRDGTKTYKECVDTYTTVYQAQCDIENEEAAKAKKAGN